MRIVICLAALLATGAVSAQDALQEAMLKVATGTLAPMQMPDGSKRWRFVRKPTRLDTDAFVTELIAHGLADAHWCGSGWEETSRSTVSGMLMVEGRCK